MSSWPLLKLTQDTTFYFFANHVKVCSFFSDYFRNCLFGVPDPTKGEEKGDTQTQAPESSTIILMENRNKNNQFPPPPPPPPLPKRNRYLRPPIIEPVNPNDPNTDDLMKVQGQRDYNATGNQAKLGARIQITGPSSHPTHLVREPKFGLISPGNTAAAGRQNTSGGGGPSSGTGVQGVNKDLATMGNQGIRQHVETSTKTGVFHLSKAKLHEFPPELAKIVIALRSIDLSENKIAMIPQNISAFVNLKHLNLNYNQIEVIPDQIGQLVKLETLSLSNNRIKTVSPTLSNLQKLRDVNLSSNQLTSFPVVFSSLKYLTVLDLARNRIPEVPDGVGGLQVVELILNQNQVRSVSKDLANCPNLKTLRLQENTLELVGLPKEILMNSPVSLLSLEGNLFDVKQLQDVEGYEKYMERYTSTKKKLT